MPVTPSALALAAILGTSVLLGACGGGGGSGGSGDGVGSKTTAGTGTGTGSGPGTSSAGSSSGGTSTRGASTGGASTGSPSTGGTSTRGVSTGGTTGSTTSVGSSDDADEPGVNGTYLYVSVPSYYFGTRDVGTSTTETIEIQNRSGDAYPLKSIGIGGDDADEFVTPLYDDEVVLGAAQAIRVPVSFQPLDGGRKSAKLEIDYERIVQVTEAVNVQEQNYYRGWDQAREGEFRPAQASYREYLDSGPVTINGRRAAVRMPIMQEADLYGEGPDSQLYLEALDARDRDRPEEALVALDRLLETNADGSLADDARYLKGYVSLMDLDDPAAALREFERLGRDYPDTTYRDTALYAEAIAQERLGNGRLARSLYETLRDRHTGFVAFGFAMPRDDVVSRLWFDRADEALDALEDPAAA